MTLTPELTEQQRADLDVARSLVAAGVPLFLAYPDDAVKAGFKPPRAWERSRPDPAVVDAWRPGLALCAVMGHGLDLVDVDPRAGGDPAELPGGIPRAYGEAATPSGGAHLFIRSLGVGSRDGITAGVDLKGGAPDGTGHGFAFIAPTVRASAVTGEPAPYRWVSAPAGWREAVGDDSGAALAARVRELKGTAVARTAGGPSWWREFLANREPQAAAAADRAIAEKLAEVAEWTPVSGANFRATLMRAAMTLGGYVGSGYLDESDAWVRLEQAAAAVWGATDEDDRRWIGQGLTDGARSPFHVYTPEDELLHGEAAQAVATQREPGPIWSPYREIGTDAFDPVHAQHDQELAEHVVARTAPIVRYAADSGSWVVRGPECWTERDDLSGWSVAMVARLMPLGETPVPKDAAKRTPGHWQAVRRNRLMSSGGASAVERKVRAILRGGEHPAAVELAGLDAHPEVLWAGGTPWDLRRSGDEPVAAGIDPATPHLRTAECAPSDVPTPAWDRFVETVWPDAEVRAWALRVLAIALAGYPDAALPVLYGPERSGKTALVTLLVRLLGGYGHSADPRLLAATDNTHASVVYALKGRRLSFIDEGPRRGHLAAERLKQLTGGGHLTGNAMRANPVTFAPTHTLVMTTNDEPPITDPALRARVRLIPCESEQGAVRAARRAITDAVWRAEAPGVLAALMRECAAWLADPDTASNELAPAALRALVDDIVTTQDPVHEWVETRTTRDEIGMGATELYEAFCAWHAGQARYGRAIPLTLTAWGRRLTELGYPWHYGGGRANRKYRPLVLLGGGGPTAPGPVPAPPATTGVPPGGIRPGLPTVGPTVADGSAGQLAEPENSRSGGVSGSVSDTSDSCLRTSTQHTQHITHIEQQTYTGTEKVGAELAAPSELSAHPLSPAEMSPDGQSATVGTTGGHPSDVVIDSAGYPPDDASPQVKPRISRARLTPEEKAARAAERKARAAAERSAARAEAVRQAAGEVLALPAVVDRAGRVIPVTPDQAAAVVRAALGRAGALTVDVETSGYPVGHRDYALRTVQLGDDTAAAVLDPVAHAELVRELLAEAPALHAHSATADLVPLAHAGLIDTEDAWSRMHDTVIPAKLADPQSTGSDPGLKDLAKYVLAAEAVAPAADAARSALFKAGKWLTETEVTTPIERSGWAQVESGSATMLRYAASDVLDTAAISRRIPLPAPHVYERERLVQRMTARVTHRGVPLDPAQIDRLTEAHTEAMGRASERLRGFGVDKPGSDLQVGGRATELGATLPMTPTGRPSVAAGALEPLASAPGELGEFVATVLAYRHHETALTTFLGPYRTLCEHGDGRARPTVYTLGTDTGRMSCVRPNLQQLPRQGGVRACLTADPGHVLISADFSGVEIRVAAALSQDPTLIRLLAEGRDLHAEVARIVFGPEATKAHRYTAKRIVFGRLYGGGLETLARQGKTDPPTAQLAVDTLDELTPELSRWSHGIRTAVREGRTQFESYSGRVIHLPREFPHKGPNYCIQGTARELLVDALTRWERTPWGGTTLLPVHDELVVMVPEADATEATAELVRCMTSNLHGVDIVAEPSAPAFAWQDSA